MLNEDQRKKVMEMFSGGKGVSEIAQNVGVSRQTVYRVIRSDFKEDTEIQTLKKELKRAELQKQIKEVRKPLKIEKELGVMERAIDDLTSWVLAMWYMNPVLKKIVPWCVFCGDELEYVEHKEKGGRVDPGYRCNRCRKTFFFP